MKKFSELLKMFREESGFSKTDLSEKIGLKRPNYIIDIETGGRKPPQPSTLQKIITALQLDPEEATELRAAAERERIPQEFIHLIEKHQTSMGLQTDIQAALSPRGLVQIPLLGQCPASPKSITEGEIEAYYWFPKKVVGGRRLYLLRADGDSMNKADINNGDLVLVDADAAPENGQITVVRIDGECTMKRFYKTDHKITLVPDSTNPKHAPEVYGDDSEIQILGVVKFNYMKGVK